jgi:hypothetical protein
LSRTRVPVLPPAPPKNLLKHYLSWCHAKTRNLSVITPLIASLRRLSPRPLVQFTDGVSRNYRRIRLNMRFQNLTDHDLVRTALEPVFSRTTGKYILLLPGWRLWPRHQCPWDRHEQNGEIKCTIPVEGKSIRGGYVRGVGSPKGLSLPRSYDVSIDEIDQHNLKLVARNTPSSFEASTRKASFLLLNKSVPCR